MNARSFLLTALSCLLHGAPALAEPTITLHFEERAPYVVRDADGVSGLTAGAAARAFKTAQVPFVWEAGSMSRQLHIMRQNQGRHCAVSWFKTSERMTFAKFTKPIYRDGPIVALARRDFSFAPGQTVVDVLAIPGVRVLVRGKYSYGSYIDSALVRIGPTLVSSAQPNVQLVDLLIGNRADFIFASEEEAVRLLARAAAKGGSLHVLRFGDMVAGIERHIACSASVSDETIERLNSAISFK